MFCPKCAAQNLDGASYCRVCGANIGLVSQAMTGQLQQAGDVEASRFEKRLRKRYGKEPSLDGAFRSAFMGLAFLLVAIAISFSRGGGGWWFWMLIPAFSMMGTGIAQYIRYREQQNRPRLERRPTQAQLQPQAPTTAFPIRNTGELVAPPPSVTEGTTRHLGAEAPTRHLDPSNELPK
ncbi:MAG: zinc ribbon domain-containing protein [Acidobacteriota bacterium]